MIESSNYANNEKVSIETIPVSKIYDQQWLFSKSITDVKIVWASLTTTPIELTVAQQLKANETKKNLDNILTTQNTKEPESFWYWNDNWVVKYKLSNSDVGIVDNNLSANTINQLLWQSFKTPLETDILNLNSLLIPTSSVWSIDWWITPTIWNEFK
jgi:hypothetical protein